VFHMKQYGIEFEDDKAGTNIGLSLSISCREKKGAAKRSLPQA
jgi:hypothetical protein